MKKLLIYFFMLALTISSVSSCTNNTELNAIEPVTLTMWHVYGEQADSPMNVVIDEFNETAGKENGIIIDVTMVSNASQIGTKLTEAQKDSPGAPEMPDLFFCHSNNADLLGADKLVDWKDYFSDKELGEYVPEFLDDGMVDDKLCVFPVSKSTHLLFIAGGPFKRFSESCDITQDMLLSWDGFFDVAQRYYDWSGGKAFCALDYPMRCIELYAIANGAKNIHTQDGWYDLENEILKEAFIKFAESIAKGHIIVSDMYSNTQVMTGDVICGLGSSASILYYNDTITYADNTSEPTDLMIIPLPQATNKEAFMTQAGVGLCSYKTTNQKAKAASIFAKWFTEDERNLSFVVSTGYMPVKLGSFEKTKDYEFKDDKYRNLYSALSQMKNECVALSEPKHPSYYGKLNTFYDVLRLMQLDLTSGYLQGEDINILTQEIWNEFTAIS